MEELTREQIMKLFDNRLRRDPNNVDLLIRRAHNLLIYGWYEESLDCVNSLIEAHPLSEIAYFIKGAVLNHLDKYDESVESYDKALEINPNFREALHNKILSLLDNKSFDWDYYNSIMKITKLIPDVNKKVLEENRRILLQIKENNPTSFEIAKAQAEILCFFKQYDHSVTKYNICISMKPDDSNLYKTRDLIIQMGEVERNQTL